MNSLTILKLSPHFTWQRWLTRKKETLLSFTNSHLVRLLIDGMFFARSYSDKYSNVTIFCMPCAIFKTGACPKSHGMHVARLAGLDEDVVKCSAEKVLWYFFDVIRISKYNFTLFIFHAHCIQIGNCVLILFFIFLKIIFKISRSKWRRMLKSSLTGYSWDVC